MMWWSLFHDIVNSSLFSWDGHFHLSELAIFISWGSHFDFMRKPSSLHAVSVCISLAKDKDSQIPRQMIEAPPRLPSTSAIVHGVNWLPVPFPLVIDYRAKLRGITRQKGNWRRCSHGCPKCGMLTTALCDASPATICLTSLSKIHHWEPFLQSFVPDYIYQLYGMFQCQTLILNISFKQKSEASTHPFCVAFVWKNGQNKLF